MGVAGIRIALLGAALTMAFAPAARAQETLTASSPTAEWSGTILLGLVATSYQDHEIKLGESGTLEAEYVSTGPGALEVAIHIVIPDPNDSFNDQVIASASGPLPKVSVSGLAAGTYVVRTQGSMNAPTQFRAKATLLPGPATRQPPQGPGGGQTQPPPPPQATPTPSPTPEAPPPPEDLSDTAPTAKVRTAGATSLAGTAADDKGVTRVDVAVVRTSKQRTCFQMRPNFTFARLRDCGTPTSFVTARGTTKWSLRLRRKLARGRYVLFVRPLDTANATSITRRAFTVR